MHLRQSQLSYCLSALYSWFCHNGPQQQYIWICSDWHPPTSAYFPSCRITYNSWHFHPITIKTLGVILDQNLTLNKHVSSLSCNIHFYTRALRHIRTALTESIAATLGASLVESTLDYANCIMYGMSASNMHKLQFAQHSLTCVVLPSLCHLSASEWLTSTGFLSTTEYSSTSLHSPTEHVSGAWAERSGKRSGATRKLGGAERSGERAWEKNGGAERSAEREVAERERSVERAELAAHSPLQCNISLISKVYHNVFT